MWFKNGHKYNALPKVTNHTKYKALWQKWWRGLQPKWRPLDDGTFLQEVPDIDEEWKDLRRGGPGGFIVIVLAFSWFVKATDAGTDDVELHKLHNEVDDITWVLNCMADMSAADQLVGGKRGLVGVSDTSGKKRCVLSFSISSQANTVDVTGAKSELDRRGERT